MPPPPWASAFLLMFLLGDRSPSLGRRGLCLDCASLLIQSTCLLAVPLFLVPLVHETVEPPPRSCRTVCPLSWHSLPTHPLRLVSDNAPDAVRYLTLRQFQRVNELLFSQKLAPPSGSPSRHTFGSYLREPHVSHACESRDA